MGTRTATAKTFRSPVARLAVLATAFPAALGGLPAQPASAYPGAFFDTQSQGDRGVDTQAVQYLLQAHGQATGAPPPGET